MFSRRALIVVCSFAMAIGVFQVRPAAAQKIQKLMMGYPTPGAGVTAEVIRRGGFFKKYGLDVHLVLLSGSSLLATAMISGQVPVSQVGAAPMVVAAVAGADTVLLACATSFAYGRLFSTRQIKSITDLKGKRIGLTRLGTIDDGLLRYVFKERGLNPDRDITFLAAGSGAERLVALGKGTIDAAIFRAPHDSFAERSGFNELLDVNKASLYNPASCVGTTKTYVRNNRDNGDPSDEGIRRRAKVFQGESRIRAQSRRRANPNDGCGGDQRGPGLAGPAPGENSLCAHERNRVPAKNRRAP
jgi:ABC-type nitrate/sulfonate/bicarbonate transport system substrate-binding protein